MEICTHNPADCVTQGLTTVKLLNNATWLNSAEFLQACENKWPENKIEKLQAAEKEERKFTISSHIPLVTSKNQLVVGQESLNMLNSANRLDVERYSDWNHMVRIYA